MSNDKNTTETESAAGADCRPSDCSAYQEKTWIVRLTEVNEGEFIASSRADAIAQARELGSFDNHVSSKISARKS